MSALCVGLYESVCLPFKAHFPVRSHIKTHLTLCKGGWLPTPLPCLGSQGCTGTACSRRGAAMVPCSARSAHQHCHCSLCSAMDVCVSALPRLTLVSAIVSRPLPPSLCRPIACHHPAHLISFRHLRTWTACSSVRVTLSLAQLLTQTALLPCPQGVSLPSKASSRALSVGSRIVLRAMSPQHAQVGALELADG